MASSSDGIDDRCEILFRPVPFFVMAVVVDEVADGEDNAGIC